MRARQVDGFISATARLDRELLADVAAGGTPLVLVNRSLEDGSVPAVTVDDRRGIQLAVDHIAALGHDADRPYRRPAEHLDRTPAITSASSRRCAASGSTRRSTRSDTAAGSAKRRARACAQRAARRRRGLTAIVAANDLLAIGCYDALEARGLRCREDISIVGFNDMPFVDHLRPPLTTVRVPQREIGNVAAELLLERLADGIGNAPREILLEPALVIRGSTAAPPEAAPKLMRAIDVHAHVTR